MNNHPIVLIVKNISGRDLKEVELFDALKTAWKKKTYNNNEVSITSGNPSLSYKDILLSIATSDILIIGCICISGFDPKKWGFDLEKKEGEFLLRLTTTGLSGIIAGQVISLKYHPEQQQPSILKKDTQFCVDKRTSLILPVLFCDEAVVIQLFPKELLNPAINS